MSKSKFLIPALAILVVLAVLWSFSGYVLEFALQAAAPVAIVTWLYVGHVRRKKRKALRIAA